MKKTIIFVMAMLVASTILAQERVANFPQEESQIAKKIREKFSTKKSILETFAQTPQPKRAPSASGDTIIDPNFIGYTNPQGTFFLGFDEDGKGVWFEKNSTNGVIGAWSDTIKAWKWKNNVSDFKKVKFETSFSLAYPSWVEDAYYYTDNKGNFYDSIVARGGLQEAYYMGADGDADLNWRRATPRQYITMPDGTVKAYQMLKASSSWCKGLFPWAIGGLPSSKTEDGLWPLTQAEPIQEGGVNYQLYDSTKTPVQDYYLFGSNSISTPNKMVTVFDRPQAPLYVKNITMALGAKGYKAAKKSELKVGTLTLEIQDMQGQVIATLTADNSNRKAITYSSSNFGMLLTFTINKVASAYDEPLNEGILLRDSFQLVLTGFANTNNFGIYAAKTRTHKSNTTIYYGDNAVKRDFEPYIMLNGIMTTWEPYSNYALAEQYGYHTGAHGDTIDINFVTAQSPYYKYVAHYAGKDFSSGSEFDFYSTFVPYDSITRIWKLDMDLPNYVTIGGGYDENIGDEENPVTLWDYMRLFWLKIYATDTPKIGDNIKIGKCGRFTYFKVVSIDGGKTPEEIEANQKKQHESIKKVLDSNCQIRIIKDGCQYDILGTKIY